MCDGYVLLGTHIADRSKDVLGAQSFQVLDGDRAPISPVLSGHSRVAESLGALDDIAGEPPVV